MTARTTRTMGICALIGGALGLNSLISEPNRLKNDYMTRQPVITDSVRNEAEKYAKNVMGLSELDYFTKLWGSGVFISGGAYLALGSKKREEDK